MPEEARSRRSPLQGALPCETAALTLHGTVVVRLDADPDRGKSPGLGIHFREGDGTGLDPVRELARRLDEAVPRADTPRP